MQEPYKGEIWADEILEKEEARMSSEVTKERKELSIAR